MYNKILIMGAGGVGFWTAIGLAREPEIEMVHVWDKDLVDGSGGRRLPIPESLISSLTPPAKVQILKDFAWFNLGARVATHQGLVTEQSLSYNFTTRKTLIVDCTDLATVSRRQIIKSPFDEHYLRISYDGNGWVVVAKGFALGDPAVGGYTRVPSFAESLAAGGIGASAVLRAVRHGIDSVSDYQVNLQTGECLSTYTPKEDADANTATY